MPTSAGPDIIQNGLVLALDASDRNSYPGTGTSWTDLSGNGNTGTLTNGPTFNTGSLGSIVFDGTNDNVTTTTNFGSNPLPIHTISIWFRTSTANGAKIIGVENQQTGQGSTIADRHLNVGTDGKLYYGVYDTTNRIVTSSMTVTDNTWRNATAVATGANSISLYINGSLNATGIGNGYASYTTSYIRIASYALSPPNASGWVNALNGYFSGSLAQALVYNRALSATEILQNYNATRTKFGL